ncbi:MAG: terminase small subunit [Desulfoprunum sp.]
MMTLTPKQEAFCLAYLETGNASEAYRKAYQVRITTTKKSINESASALLATPKISSRIEELRAKIIEKFVWERHDSLIVLSGIARSATEPATSRIAAVKELNAMHGYNAPSQHRHQFVNDKGEPVTGINITVRAVAPGEVKSEIHGVR